MKKVLSGAAVALSLVLVAQSSEASVYSVAVSAMVASGMVSAARVNHNLVTYNHILDGIEKNVADSKLSPKEKKVFNQLAVEDLMGRFKAQMSVAGVSTQEVFASGIGSTLKKAHVAAVNNNQPELLSLARQARAELAEIK